MVAKRSVTPSDSSTGKSGPTADAVGCEDEAAGARAGAEGGGGADDGTGEGGRDNMAGASASADERVAAGALPVICDRFIMAQESASRREVALEPSELSANLGGSIAFALGPRGVA